MSKLIRHPLPRGVKIGPAFKHARAVTNDVVITPTICLTLAQDVPACLRVSDELYKFDIAFAFELLAEGPDNLRIVMPCGAVVYLIGARMSRVSGLRAGEYETLTMWDTRILKRISEPVEFTARAVKLELPKNPLAIS